VKLKLVCDGLISQYVDLAVQLQIARGVKLAHEDDDQVFFGINGKFGIEESAPAVFAGRSQFLERGWSCANALLNAAKTKRIRTKHSLRDFCTDIFMFCSSPLLSNFVTERTGRLRACPRVAGLGPTNRARHRER
jgi:hypothetical protein